MTEFDNQIMETNLLYATHTHSEVKVKQQLPHPTKTKNGKRKVNVQICLYKKKTNSKLVLFFCFFSFHSFGASFPRFSAASISFRFATPTAGRSGMANDERVSIFAGNEQRVNVKMFMLLHHLQDLLNFWEKKRFICFILRD